MVAPAVPQQPLRDGSERTGGPSLTGEALLALAFLAGFYVLAFAVVAALVALNVVLYATAGRVYAQVVIVTVVVTLAVVRGVFFVTRSDEQEFPGLPVDEHSQPQLVGLVRSVAEEMATEPPSRVILVPQVNAAVTQTGGLLGLRPGERVMLIGVPLIDALTVDQLRGVIAHELGHYAGGDTRFGALTYRAGASIYRTVENLGDDSLLGRIFAAYGHRYLVLSLRVRRRQELSADAAGVRLAGRENHMTALRRIEVTAYAFDHFLRRYLAPLWQRGCDAENAFEGYRALLSDPSRREELASLEVSAQDRTTDRYDSHPSLAERLAHAQGLPEGPTAGHDPRPARELLTGADDVERQVGAVLTRELTGRRMERVVRWDTTAAGEFAVEVCADGEALLRAAATVSGDPEAASLASVVALIEAGRAEELATAVTGPLEDHTPAERSEVHRSVLRYYLGGAIGAYLTAERGHTWTVSWSGPVGLLDDKGTAKDPFDMAAAFLDDPSLGPRLRRALGGVARLRDFRTSVADEPAPEPEGPSIVDVVPDVKTNRGEFDLVLTTAGLVLHPIAGGLARSMHQLAAIQGVHGPMATAAQRRLEKLFSLSLDEVLGQAAGAVVLPFGGFGDVRKRRRCLLEVEVAGDAKPWRFKCPSKQARDALHQLVQELIVAQVAPAAPVAA